MNDANPYESGSVEPERGKSKLWIIVLIVCVLAGITCLPVLGGLAYMLLLNEAPMKAPNEPQLQPKSTIESISGESQEFDKDVENGE